MRKIEILAHNIFPLMALSGLLLAGWALIATPDNLKSGSEAAAVSAASNVNSAASAAVNEE